MQSRSLAIIAILLIVLLTPLLPLSAQPNTSDPTIALSYKLQAASRISLKVYDTAGRLVATLVEGWRVAGSHEVTCDGSRLASGIYLYTLQAGGESTTGKMLLLK